MLCLWLSYSGPAHPKSTLPAIVCWPQAQSAAVCPLIVPQTHSHPCTSIFFIHRYNALPSPLL